MEKLPPTPAEIRKRRIQFFAANLLSALRHQAAPTRVGEEGLPRKVDRQAAGTRPRHRHHRHQQVEPGWQSVLSRCGSDVWKCLIAYCTIVINLGRT